MQTQKFNLFQRMIPLAPGETVTRDLIEAQYVLPVRNLGFDVTLAGYTFYSDRPVLPDGTFQPVDMLRVKVRASITVISSGPHGGLSLRSLGFENVSHTTDFDDLHRNPANLTQLIPPVLLLSRRMGTPQRDALVTRLASLDPFEGCESFLQVRRLGEQHNAVAKLAIDKKLFDLMCPIDPAGRAQVVAYHLFPFDWSRARCFDDLPSRVFAYVHVPGNEYARYVLSIGALNQMDLTMSASACWVWRAEFFGANDSEPLIAVPVARRFFTSEA